MFLKQGSHYVPFVLFLAPPRAHSKISRRWLPLNDIYERKILGKGLTVEVAKARKWISLVDRQLPVIEYCPASNQCCQRETKNIISDGWTTAACWSFTSSINSIWYQHLLWLVSHKYFRPFFSSQNTTSVNICCWSISSLLNFYNFPSINVTPNHKWRTPTILAPTIDLGQRPSVAPLLT